MIFAFILLLQLVQYNVQGKHLLVETKDDNSMEPYEDVDLQESEGKDYNLGGLDQLDQLKKELRYKIKLLGPRQSLNFSLFPEDRSSREATHPNHPSFRFLAKLC